MSNGGLLMKTYDGVIEKPELNDETLAHFGLAKAVHKYIDKYMGKNGKWIYRYASTAKSAATGAINKAKTMLPGMQKKATSLVSKGTKIASSQYSQARKRMSSLLPGLYRKRTTVSNGVRKTVKRANQITRKTYSSARKNLNKTSKIVRNKTHKYYQKTRQKLKYGGSWSDRNKKSSIKKDKVDAMTGNYKNYMTRMQVGGRHLAGTLDNRFYPKSYLNNKLGDVKLKNRPRSRRKNVTSGVGKVYKRKIR